MPKSHRQKFVAGSISPSEIKTLSGAITMDAEGVTTLAETLVKYAEVAISSAEILALFAAPKVLLPAPAAGKYYEVLGCSLIYEAGGIAYTIGAAGNLTLNYSADGSGNAVTVPLAATGFLDNATDLVRNLKLTATNVEPVIGVGGVVVLKIATASPTLGNGTLRAKVAYRIHTSGL
jgi:hypothetical protein